MGDEDGEGKNAKMKMKPRPARRVLNLENPLRRISLGKKRIPLANLVHVNIFPGQEMIAFYVYDSQVGACKDSYIWPVRLN